MPNYKCSVCNKELGQYIFCKQCKTEKICNLCQSNNKFCSNCSSQVKNKLSHYNNTSRYCYKPKGLSQIDNILYKLQKDNSSFCTYTCNSAEEHLACLLNTGNNTGINKFIKMMMETIKKKNKDQRKIILNKIFCMTKKALNNKTIHYNSIIVAKFLSKFEEYEKAKYIYDFFKKSKFPTKDTLINSYDFQKNCSQIDCYILIEKGQTFKVFKIAEEMLQKKQYEQADWIYDALSDTFHRNGQLGLQANVDFERLKLFCAELHDENYSRNKQKRQKSILNSNIFRAVRIAKQLVLEKESYHKETVLDELHEYVIKILSFFSQKKSYVFKSNATCHTMKHYLYF
ncbi:MAG: hypothetical protein AAGA27_07195, partial [Pseudomonadota bacterium]